MFHFDWLFRFGAFVLGLTNLIAEESLIIGESQAIGADGSMVVCHYANSEAANNELWVHFHGLASVAADNFTKAKINGVLVVINFNGLSAAYSKPFREAPDLFQEVLEQTAAHLRSPWKRLTVSSFSAGYGAVREILKTPEYFQRIDALVASDSMYASLIQGTESRQPLKDHMRNYLRFAKLAAEGKKTLLISHTNQETAYASTTETANYLIESVGIKRETTSPRKGEPLPLRSKATKDNFTVLGYEGTTGDDHMQHLRQIHLWWRLLNAVD